MNFLLGLIFSTIFLTTYAIALSAPYAVTIWLKPGQGSAQAEHLCNGAIVHESVIITSASCLHYTLPGSVISHPVIPPMISVVAGDLTYMYAKIIRNVINIMTVPGYNAVTKENDVALLILNESLPLAARTDIQWIILDDNDHVNQTCVANFNNSSSYVYTTGPPQPILVMDSKFCNNSIGISTYNRRRDICSSYVLNPGVMCNITEDSLRKINDRGTPLVCDSKLFGLLSAVITPDHKYNASCSQQRRLNAYYSRVAPHLGWIYEVIARGNSKTVPKTNHTIAPPFEGKPIPQDSASKHMKKTSGALGTHISQSLQVILLATVLFVNICAFV